MKKKLRIATRQSPMALRQTNFVREQLERANPDLECEILPMLSSGDQFLQDTLAAKGGKGLFVKELQHALLGETADISVHSLKDVTVTLPEGLALGAFLKREDPRDALVSHRYENLAALPQGARIGTASLRRKALLKHFRPDLNIEILRGNVVTRLKKLETENFDAIILAAAGLARLGLEDQIKQYFDPHQFVPAITQGILAVEYRLKDAAIKSIIEKINDPETELLAKMERAFNRRLGGACHVPVAGFAEIRTEKVHMIGLVADVDGKKLIRDEITGPIDEAESLGAALAEKLIAQGAEDILKPWLS